MIENGSLQGRIWFPGNPWPEGHKITSCTWSGHIQPGRGLSLFFEIKTEEYYAADGTHIVEDESEGVSEWASKVGWNNYGSCWIGPSQTSFNPGILVSDGTKPFDLTRDEYVFTADPLPVDWETFLARQAFGIYLLGHDAVADHRIHLRKNSADGSYALDWSGKIARAYVGKESFDHRFQARVAGVRFDAIGLMECDPAYAKDYYGIDLDPQMTPYDHLSLYVTNPDDFVIEERRGRPYAVLER